MTPAPRQARDRRRPGVRVELSPRDELLLTALGRFRAATTTPLLQIAFAGIRRDTGIARLRRLYDAKFVAVRAQDRMAENIYSLGPKGRAWLLERGAEVGPLPRGNLAHHLAIVRVWTAIVLEAQRTPGLHLDLVQADWSIRQHVPASAPVIPDALVQLTVPDLGPIRLAFEIDLTTETVAVLRDKIDRYETLRQTDDGLFGWQRFTLAVALVGAALTRQRAIQQLLNSRWGGPALVWNVSDDVPLNSLHTLLRSLASDCRLPLRTGTHGGVSRCRSNRLIVSNRVL